MYFTIAIFWCTKNSWRSWSSVLIHFTNAFSLVFESYEMSVGNRIVDMCESSADKMFPIICLEEFVKQMNCIRDIERERGVEVIFASIVGSKSWGTSDEKSDTDLRFVYVEKITFEKVGRTFSDTIHFFQDNLDVVGYELCKFLRMLKMCNTTAVEIVETKLIVLENECFTNSCKEYLEHNLATKKTVARKSYYGQLRGIKEIKNVKTAKWMLVLCGIVEGGDAINWKQNTDTRLFEMCEKISRDEKVLFTDQLFALKDSIDDPFQEKTETVTREDILEELFKINCKI